jgi:hypothetical protein
MDVEMEPPDIEMNNPGSSQESAATCKSGPMTIKQ